MDRKTVYRWTARYEAEGAEGFLPRERNRVYSPELNMRVVADYFSEQESALELSKRYKISDPCLVEAWVKKHNVHGDFYSVKFSGEGSYMKRGRDTTQEEPIQMEIERLKEELCRSKMECGLLKNWMKL